MSRKLIPYPYYQICLDCGSKYGDKDKRVMGVWEDLCPVCGRTTTCAAAGHDFGVYNIPASAIKRENLFKYGGDKSVVFTTRGSRKAHARPDRSGDHE